MKKRLITLLLAVIMVMSLLPMSASAATPDATYYLFAGSSRQNYNVGGTGVLGLQTVHAVIYAEPGSKLSITAGKAFGQSASFPVNEALDKTDKSYLPDEYETLAEQGKDFTKDWRGNGTIFNRNRRLINISKDATTGKVIKVHPKWTGQGWLYIIIADRDTIINKALNDTDKPVRLATLRNASVDNDVKGIPGEPGYHGDLSYYYYKYHEKNNYQNYDINYKVGADGGIDPKDCTLQNSGAGLISPNVVKYLTSSFDGTNTVGVVDITGKNIMACFTDERKLNLGDMLNEGIWLTREEDHFAVFGYKHPSFVATDGYNTRDDGDRAHTETYYKIVPYVMKLESDGWHIDTALVPKDAISLSYNANLPEGFSVPNIQLPPSTYNVKSEIEKTTFGNMKITNPDKDNVDLNNDCTIGTNTKIYAMDSDGYTYQLKFKGWSKTKCAVGATADYQPGEKIKTYGDTNIYYATWDITQAGIIVTKELKTSGDSQTAANSDLEFSFTFSDDMVGKKYYTHRYDSTEGENKDSAEQTYSKGAVIKIKAGERIVFPLVDVGSTQYTVTESLAGDTYAGYAADELSKTVTVKNEPDYQNVGFVNTYSDKTYSITTDCDSHCNATADVASYRNENKESTVTLTKEDGYYIKSVAIDAANDNSKDKVFSDAEIAEINNGGTIKLTHNDSYKVTVKSEKDTFNPNAAVVVDFAMPIKCDLKNYMGYYYNNPTAGTNKLSYGTASLTGNELKYTPSKNMCGVDSYQYTATHIDGTTTKNMTVKFIPATSVYYEDSFGDGTDAAFVHFDANWHKDGTTQNKVLDAKTNEAYGYDKNYGNFTTYSMGSAMKATVSKANSSVIPTADFTFTGTGFDIYSYTDSTAGAVKVSYKLRGSDDPAVAKIINDYSANAYYQIPTISFKDLPYGTYDVTVKLIYNKLFDTAKAETYNFWFDAVRIYEPAKTSGAAQAQYMLDGEGNAQYICLRDSLLGIKAVAELKDPKINADGVIFVDKSGEHADSVDMATLTDYSNYGPKNEIYLKQNQAIVFEINADNVADIQIGAKSATKGTTKLVINGNTEKPIIISTATDMYYSIKDLIGSDNKVVISNASDSADQILSLTNLKITYNQQTNHVASILSNSNSAKFGLMTMAKLAAPVAPSDDPGANPTEEPSTDPTVEPSTDPTVDPSTDPTEDPSTDPTENPSTDPTEDPSTDPSTDDDGGNDEQSVVAQIVTKVVSFVKNVFGKLFGGKAR